MLKLRYKQRIHKNKLSLRSARYALADQAARLFPPLRERWLFPSEAIPMPLAAVAAESFECVAIAEPPPAAIARLVKRPIPLESAQKVYTFEDATLLGASGALVQRGKLLAVRHNPNWAVSLRPRRYERVALDRGVLHYALTPPAPAIAHVFHWIFDYVAPFMTWLEGRSGGETVRPILNAAPTEFQRRTLDFLMARYGVAPPVFVGQGQAAQAPRVAASVLEPWSPRAMQAPAGVKALADLANFLSEGRADPNARRRIYVSRNDAKLRRVANEAEIAPILLAQGFEIVTLKGMPIAEQVRLFVEAAAVFAPHGAGLAHIAWMRPGARVTEFLPRADGPLGPPKNATANFWIVSRQKRLAYAAFDGAPQTNRHDLFEIPPQTLQAALDEAGL